MIDPIGLGAALLGANGAWRLAALLIECRMLRDRAELVRNAAALAPGTRIVSRDPKGTVTMLVSIAPGRDAQR
ncbi:hypothetical protein [Dactylosporangium salmoneum]|uniref:Uncharacterized protein n=1 Tax=Dactylosporangium salmoneum TaxID=53361 RepID=A0ABP5SXN8_9ACTN